MLMKLLKYDLKYMFKNMAAFYILAIFFSITTRILFSLNQTVIVNLMGQISVGCMFSMVCSIIFNIIIRTWVRFKDSIYKDESYLTHTLPVTKTQIYESRFLESVIFTIGGFIIMVISIFISYYTYDRWLLLKDTINSISAGLSINTWFIIISIIIILFLEIINIIQNGFLGIIMGYRKNNNKNLYSLVFGFVSYMILQAFVLLSVFIVGLFNKNVMSIFNSTLLLDIGIIKLLVVLLISIYLIIIVVMNIICSKQLDKGVNVE